MNEYELWTDKGVVRVSAATLAEAVQFVTDNGYRVKGLGMPETDEPGHDEQELPIGYDQ